VRTHAWAACMHAHDGLPDMQCGVDMREVRDYDARTPLHLAASEGSLTTAEWLLARGVDASAVDRFGRTPMMEALQNSHTAVAQALLQVRSAAHTQQNAQRKVTTAQRCGRS
jgi:ankyrin repeat protein